MVTILGQRPRWRRVPLLRGDDRGRPGLIVQVPVIGFLLIAYDALRNLAPGRTGLAFRNAREVLRVEGRLDLNPERTLNAWLSHHHLLGLLASDYYDSAHYLVTIPLLAGVYVAFPGCYRRLRDVLVATNIVGLLGFWLYPLAPPRMLPGYTDTVAVTHALGGWSTTISHNADEYAAMPSLHMGWALWVAVAVFAVTRRSPTSGQRLGRGAVAARAAACLHVLLTATVILSTGNHYVLDALAGATCLSIAVGTVALGRHLFGSWARRHWSACADRQELPAVAEPVPSEAAPPVVATHDRSLSDA